MKIVGRRAFMFALVLLTLLMPYSHAGASFRHKSETIIDGGSGNAYRTDIAFDGLGNAIAVFEQKTADGYRLYANHYSTKEGWSGPLMIDAGVRETHTGVRSRQTRLQAPPSRYSSRRHETASPSTPACIPSVPAGTSL